MDKTDVERKCEALRIGSEKLVESAAESKRAWDFIAEMMTKHSAQMVGDLPPAVQARIVARLRNLKSDAWTKDETRRLDALSTELLLLGPLGPVN